MSDYFLYDYELRILETWENLLEGFLHLSLAEIKTCFGAKGVVGGVPRPRYLARQYRKKHTTDWDLTDDQYMEVLGDMIGGFEELSEPNIYAIRDLFFRGENVRAIQTLSEAHKGTYRIWKEEQEAASDWMEDIGDALTSVKEWMMDNAAIMIIVVLVALTAIFAPSLLLTVGKMVYTILKEIGIATSKTLTTINGWITTVKGWLHIREIGAIMETVGTLSRLLERISPTWRANIVKWENEVAAASKSLFGDANTISAYLVALQMAVWDVSSLGGEPYDVFQIEWYDKATKVTTDIARKQEVYQNNPGALWYDLQEWYLKPIYGEGEEKRRSSALMVSEMSLAAETLRGNLEAVDRRLVQYEQVLKPTELEAVKKSLAAVRTSLREEAIEPLSEFRKDVTDIYIGKLPDKSFGERWKMLIQPSLDYAVELGGDEVSLTDLQKEARLRRGENLLEFLSRTARAAWDGVIGGVHKLYAETIGRLDRGEEIIAPIVKYELSERELIPSVLPDAVEPKSSPEPETLPMPAPVMIKAMLSKIDIRISSIDQEIK